MDIRAIGEVALRAVGALAAMFLLTRLMGRKQISQLTFFDYVIGISIGSIAAEMTANEDAPFLHGLTGMIIYTAFAVGISMLTDKSIRVRRWFTGKPVILIQHGKIDEKNLSRVRFDVNDLLAACRVAGAFSVDEIEFAILEANGKLSVLKKAEQLPLTPKDLGLRAEKSVLSAEVILDGEVMHRNLQGMGRDAQWLSRQLDMMHADAKDVLLAQCDENGKLTLYFRNGVRHPMNVLE